MDRKSHSSKQGASPKAIGHPARFRPWLLAGLSMLFVARPLFPSEGTAETGDGMVIVMPWMLLLLGWAFCRHSDRSLTLRWRTVDWAVLVFAFLLTLSSLVSFNSEAIRPGLNMLWEWLGLATSYFLARQLIRDGAEARAVVVLMIGLGVAVSAFGLHQVWFAYPHARAVYESDPDAALAAAGVVAPEGSRQRFLFEQRLNSSEPTATFALTNSLAGYLVPWTAVALAMLIFCILERQKRSLMLLSLSATLFMLAVCLVFTKSRAGYLALCVGTGLVILHAIGNTVQFPQARRGWLVGPIAILLAAAGFLLYSFDSDIFEGALRSLRYRIEYWQASLAMIADYPFFGCGPGNFQANYSRYMLPQSSETVADPHNFLLEIWSTAGTLAAVAFLAIVIAAVAAFCRGEHKSECHTSHRMGKHPGFAVAGGLAAFPFMFLAGPLTNVPPTELQLLAGLAICGTLSWMLWPSISSGVTPAAGLISAIVALLINLSAAGGIALPAVSGTFWLLLALLMNAAETDKEEELAHHRPRRINLLTWTPAIVALLLVGLCALTAFLPNIQRNVLMAQARTAINHRRGAEAEALLNQAQASDRWSSQPVKLLAELQFQKWQANPAPEQVKKLASAAEAAMELEPKGGPLRRRVAEWYLAIYRATNQRVHIETAIAFQDSAVQLAPNSMEARAELAWLYYVAGRLELAKSEARLAGELDAMNPHQDRSLEHHRIHDPGAADNATAASLVQSILDSGLN